MTVESDDYRRLMSAVLRQSIDDYIKLQHPRRRRKKYELEAFWSAQELLWNTDYLLDIKNAEGTFLDLEALSLAASGRENVDLEPLRQYLVEESVRYWDEKDLKTVEIPADVVVEGHVYHVEQASSTSVEYDTKTIYLDKQSPLAEEQFMQIVVELGCYHGDIRTSAKARKDLGKALYRILRINDCFTGNN